MPNLPAVIELSDGRKIGPGHPAFIIAEAGSNWRMGTPPRDLAMAKALIDVAAEAGCDAVKFQTYKASSVYVANAGESDYLSEAGIKQSITEIFEDLAMPYEMIPKLAEMCREAGIRFMSTPFSVEDLAAVDPHVDFHKIASYEISHTVLQEAVAKTGKPVVFSTGASLPEDIDFAFEHLAACGCSQIAVMQCTAKYPAPLDSANVRVVEWLSDRYGVPVGLSDHTREPGVAPAAAVALGATIIEKHYTLNNRLPGADHPFALEPAELRQLVRQVRETEAALGLKEKVLDDAETELAAFARRGVQATRAIQEGEELRLGENLEILRPGKQKLGSHPRYLASIEGKRAARRIPAGDGVFPEDAA